MSEEGRQGCWGLGGPCKVRSYVREAGSGRGSLYGEVKCIMGNGHMGPLCEQNDRHD